MQHLEIPLTVNPWKVRRSRPLISKSRSESGQKRNLTLVPYLLCLVRISDGYHVIEKKILPVCCLCGIKFSHGVVIFQSVYLVFSEQITNSMNVNKLGKIENKPSRGWIRVKKFRTVKTIFFPSKTSQYIFFRKSNSRIQASKCFGIVFSLLHHYTIHPLSKSNNFWHLPDTFHGSFLRLFSPLARLDNVGVVLLHLLPLLGHPPQLRGAQPLLLL